MNTQKKAADLSTNGLIKSFVVAYQPYGEPGIAVAEIYPVEATGLLAGRFRAELY